MFASSAFSSVSTTRAAALFTLFSAAFSVPLKVSNTTAAPCAQVSAAVANSSSCEFLSNLSLSLLYICHTVTWIGG